ncbi:MAG: DNA repair exonuclease [Gemmatimonadaceae bacterium]
MRVAHLADLHLGYRQYHRQTPNGINQREADVAQAFRRAIDRVIDIRPDLVVIAGDVFHTVRPMNPAIIDAFSQFARLTQSLPDATVVMIAGNHDRPRSTETGCILKLFSRLSERVHVVVDEPKRLSFPERNLSILAVPDMSAPYPAFDPDPAFGHNVLVFHGEIEGTFPEHLKWPDRATVEISLDELAPERWSYVALGHYHVHHQVAPNAFYPGAIEYTSTNTWAELDEEGERKLPGKGFIEYDLETAAVRFHHIESSRPLVDLPLLSARGMSAAELDAAILARVAACDGGIEDKIVRLVARDVPRHIAREIDHKAVRELKRRALNFHLDLRRPEQIRTAIGGAPGRRPTLRDIVQNYLAHRSIESGVDRPALVGLGLRYLEDADSAVAVQPSAPPTAIMSADGS